MNRVLLQTTKEHLRKFNLGADKDKVHRDQMLGNDNKDVKFDCNAVDPVTALYIAVTLCTTVTDQLPKNFPLYIFTVKLTCI